MTKTTTAYETIFIISATLDEAGVTERFEKFKALIEQNGTIESVNEWGKRRLAYPINDENEGHYYLINFSSSPEFPAELDRVYKITDGILRSIIVNKEAK